ncbi:hypothetical protein LCGC14_2155000 [marine sediment metagenome]|uniref:Scaffolding protein n=1 Tax=marine sediment metagenome TaxID=412755 RepID=A0A0F9EGP6_9ZZZZ
MPDVKDEGKTADVDEENLSDSLKVGDEEGADATSDTDEKKDEEKDEKGGDKDEEKDESGEPVEVPDLSDEQIALLAKDPRIAELRKGDETSALDELLKGAVAEETQKREHEETAKKDLATREEALKAFRDGDPAPLAELAVRAIEGAERRQAIDAAAEEGADARLGQAIQVVYGNELKAMTPEEVKALDDMPLEDAIQKLADLKAAGSKEESDAAVSEAEKAAHNAATGNSASGEKVGVLPGGSAEEGAEGDDIGALLRKGIEGSLDIEE